MKIEITKFIKFEYVLLYQEYLPDNL